MEDPAVLLARPDLDLVALRVEQDDRVLVVDAGREKTSSLLTQTFWQLKQHLMIPASMDNTSWHFQWHYEATARL